MYYVTNSKIHNRSETQWLQERFHITKKFTAVTN